MLSIGAIKSKGQGEYYLDLGREDYYLKGGEPPGQWSGRGAERLGLTGHVEAEEFRNLLSGYDPNGDNLIQNAGRKNHQPGWDLTFSAPKSVSVAWALSDQEIRVLIQQAHDKAVGEALRYLEDDFAWTRRGKGGEAREEAELVVATFQHGTSRAQDPQIHTHAIVLNVGVREDGSTGTILSKPLYQSKMAAGAVYRAELAAQLHELGYELAEDRAFFKLKGVPEKLSEEFSKRRAEILEELEKKGTSGAAASAAATMATRQVKGHASREELFGIWQQVGREYGFEEKDLKRREPERDRDPERTGALCANKAVEKITWQQSHFSERDLVRYTAEESQVPGIGAEAVRSAVRAELQNKERIVFLGRVDGEKRYTTREMLQVEKAMLFAVQEMKEEKRTIRGPVNPKSELSEEQRKALRHLMEPQGNVKVVSGMAGTGKTTLLKEARIAWEESGYEVKGASLSGKAARGLEDGSGIRSTTLHKTLRDIDAGKIELNKRTVIVVDEAGMVGTRQMNQLLSQAKASGARVVLVGDEKQLQPIEAGGAFRAIGDSLGRVELKEIRRQRDKRDIEAIHQVVGGRSKSALDSYAERGLLKVSESREEAMDALVEDYKKDGLATPNGRVIITGTRSEAGILNKKVQAARKEEGHLGTQSAVVEQQKIHVNDRVMITRRSPIHRVENGDVGTVIAIDNTRGVMTVDVEGEKSRRVHIPYRTFTDVRLGYAATTHKFQGATAEKCYVLAGGDMQDRELSYVQLSRARGETRIYIEESELKDTVAELAARMDRSRQKDLAVEVQEPRQERVQERAQERELTLER